MKKFQYIPILTLAAVLSSCSLFGGAKAPKFSDEGYEVTYSEFCSRLSEAYDNSELSDPEAKLTDRLIKGSTSDVETTVVKRDRKEISKSETTRSNKGEAQFDVDNLVAKDTGESKYNMKGSNQQGSASYTASSKTECFYQFSKISGQKYFISANTKTKQYSLITQVITGQKQENVFDEYLREASISLVDEFCSYIPKDSAAANDYLFYIKDDSLFTFSYTKEETNNYSDYVCKTKRKFKAQLDLTDKKQAFRFSNDINNEYTYKKDANGYKEGDVKTESMVYYKDFSVASKNYNLSAVDIDNYLQYNL